MNCKPGDLAVIRTNARNPENHGRFVKVVRPYQWGEILPGHESRYECCGEFAWVCKSVGQSLFSPANGWVNWIACRDTSLRPIRDPGEDATDEMLLLVGRPNERVPA